MRGIDAIAVSVCHKYFLCAAAFCALIKKMPPEEALLQLWLWNAIGSCVSLERLRHAVVKGYWLLCVSWPIASCYGTGVSFWMRCERINVAGSFSVIKTLCFTLFFAQRLRMASEDLEWNTNCLYCFYTACLWSVFAINTCDLPVCVLYCSEVGKFRVGVGLGAPIKVKMYIQLFIFKKKIACKPLH